MSYVPAIYPCPRGLKSAGQRPPGVWPFAPHRTDSGRFHRVLFPNLFPNEPACRPLSSQGILDLMASISFRRNNSARRTLYRPTNHPCMWDCGCEHSGITT